MLALIQYYGKRFGYSGVKFHREGPGVAKTCPGTSLNKIKLLTEAKAFKPGKGDSNMALRRGDKDLGITNLQLNLIMLGYGSIMEPYGADGSFGPATETALKAFQKNNGLAVDGVAGPATQAKISELLKKAGGSSTDYKKLYDDAKAKLDAIKKIVV
ncbi:MAG: peptidoglycan-binding protein [Clostridiales bacterium]|nr:peptidoglycan-binding protein [Clostridiales bacterium]